MDLREPRIPGDRYLIHISDDEYTISSHPGESPLCSICQKILDKFSEASLIRITTNLKIENRARDGCYLCSLFLHIFQSRQSTYVTPRGKHRFTTRYQNWPNGDISLSLDQYDESATLKVQQSKGPLYWAHEDSSVQGVICKGHVSDAHITPQTNTFDDTLNVASMWLQRCQAQHRFCRVAAANFLPTRLIDIGVSFQTLPSLSLCLGEDITSRARYATLSHCWGEPTSIAVRLEMNKIESMRSIDFKCLPKTFREAIQVTRRLGIRYIWIDSLCIVQACQEDWERESALMAQVYSNDIFNISATAAKDSSGGLFFNRNGIITRHIAAYLKLYSKPRQLFTFCEKELWSSSVERAPLNRRGWVLQERLLSCRNLHFARNQVIWECRESTACEMFPVAIPKIFLPGSGREEILKATYSRLIIDISRGEVSLRKFQSFWNDLVIYYSKRHLSYSTDKLVAFGGLVAQIQKAFGLRYLAGVWWDDLVNQLCWRRESNPYVGEDWDESSASSSTMSPYVAPTWSWASCSYPVENVCSIGSHQQDGTEIVVDVIGAQVDLVSNNPYGQVKGGYLVV